jgi:hypothetical protein
MCWWRLAWWQWRRYVVVVVVAAVAGGGLQGAVCSCGAMKEADGVVAVGASQWRRCCRWRDKWIFYSCFFSSPTCVWLDTSPPSNPISSPPRRPFALFRHVSYITHDNVAAVCAIKHDRWPPCGLRRVYPRNTHDESLAVCFSSIAVSLAHGD